MLDMIMDFVINNVLYKIGFSFLTFISGGRFKGESSYYFSLIILIGLLVLLVPTVLIFLGWAIWL